MEIKELTIKDGINSYYRKYAMYVLESRGIPNFYDSLTPVQRLILLNAPEKLTGTMGLIGGVFQTGLYHHGDCLAYDTEINLADGTSIRIGDWFERYPELSLLVRCVDEDNNETIGLAHSPRVGQIVTEVYEIEMEDGSVIECTNNHPFRVGDRWISAENLKESDEIINI